MTCTGMNTTTIAVHILKCFLTEFSASILYFESLTLNKHSASEVRGKSKLLMYMLVLSLQHKGFLFKSINKAARQLAFFKRGTALAALCIFRPIFLLRA